VRISKIEADQLVNTLGGAERPREQESAVVGYPWDSARLMGYEDHHLAR
jgi:hypothetical protein